MEVTDELKKSSALADRLYATILEEANLAADVVPTVAMMLLSRHFGEKAANPQYGLIQATAWMGRFTRQAHVLLFAYFAAVKLDSIKCWVDFDKFAERQIAQTKKERGS